MKKKEEFKPISKEAMSSFKKESPQIIKKTVELSLEREEEVKQHGEQAEQLITSGMNFTTRMLESAMLMGEISLLEDEFKWAQDRLPHDGVAMEHVLIRLKIYREQLIKIMPAEYASEILTYLDWMINRQNKICNK